MTLRVPRQYPVPDGLSAPEEGVWPLGLEQFGEPAAEQGTFHIDHLKSKFRDLARPNQFRVRFTTPPNMTMDWPSDMMVMAKSASFPSIEVAPIEIERAGYIINIPSNKTTFGELAITFYCDVDMKLRSRFLEWMKYACYNWTQGMGSVPTLALGGEVFVYQFDGSNRPTFAVKFTHAWPKSVGEIALSHETENAVEEFTVTFAYTYQETAS